MRTGCRKTVAESMATDPDMQKVEFNGHVIWELVDRSAAIPQLEIETPGLCQHADDDHDEARPTADGGNGSASAKKSSFRIRPSPLPTGICLSRRTVISWNASSPHQGRCRSAGLRQ